MTGPVSERVEDRMVTEIKSVAPDASVWSALAIMRQEGIRHLLVLEGDRLAGILSNRDFRKLLEWIGPSGAVTRLRDARVTDIMTCSERLVTARLGSSLSETAKLLVTKKVGCIPVVDALDRPVGLLGQKEILAAIVDGLEAKPSEIAARLEQRAFDLRDVEARYRGLVEQSLVGVYLIADDRFVYVNEALADMFGYRPDEVAGRPPLDLVHPDDRALVAGNIRMRLESRVDFVRYLFRGLRKDGTPIQCEVFGRRVPYGDRSAILGTLIDMTERKRAEEALQESERRYRLLAENATDVIWTSDLTLRFTYISPSLMRQRGYTAEEITALTPEKVLTPASLRVAMNALEEELERERLEPRDLFRSLTLELEAVRKDGSTVWTETKMTFLRDATGEPSGILGVARDITERKRAEEEFLHQREALYQSEKLAAMGELLAGVAHELNNQSTRS